MPTNFYTVLGLPPNATSRQVRERFLELARERHPDRFSGPEKEQAELDFQVVTQAFNVLSDPERRRQLDAELAGAKPKMVDSGSDAGKVYLQRGVIALRENRRADAIDNLEQSVREDPANAKAWHLLAQAAQNIPSLKERARTAAVNACELESMNPAYLELAGRICAEHGKHGQAAKYLRGAIDWGGANPELEKLFEASLQAAKTGGD